MKHTKYFFLTFVMLIFSHTPTNATVLATGNGTAGSTTFSTAIATKLYARATGTLYFGLQSGGIYKASRYSGYGTPTFTAFTSNALISGQTISFNALASALGNPSPNLAVVTSAAPAQVLAANSAGTIVAQSAVLNDASGAVGANGQSTTGIVGLAANQLFEFPIVQSATTSSFGADQNGGIAVVSINQQTLALQQTAAVSGDSGIKAYPLGPSSSTVMINSAPTLVPNVVCTFWDDPLQRLYVGLELTITNTTNGGARDVVVGQVNSSGVCTLNNFAPATSGTYTAGNATYIVAATSAGTELNLSAIKMRVMHNSTGPSYLIVNGGNDIQANVANQVYALPLVDVGDPTNATQGTLADKTAYNTSAYRFETPVTSTAGLTINTDAFARVGASPLPLTTGESIADMVVAGDTVYVSTQILTPTSTLDQARNGVFYSEALFDQTGQIVRWTPWTKRAAPFNPNLTSSTLFFDVDALNGKIWATNGDQQVYSTAWDYGLNTTSLTAVLTSTLSTGCYCALDLDQSTRGLGQSAPGRYALFGGAGKVAFALTSVSTNSAAPYNTDGSGNITPQTVPTNYASAQNFLNTWLPGSAGAVQVLEYSRRIPGTATNYFFAGTQNGLFVFSTNGNGFDVATAAPNTLNAAPFLGGYWSQISTIPGAVIDIKTSGQTLYVMTLQSTKQNPILSTIYNINFQPTIAAMFATSNITTIAESGTYVAGSDLSSAKIFQGMQIIVTSPTVGSEVEQLVVATNRGMYVSNAAGGGVKNAPSQATAQWAPVNSADITMYYNIPAADQGLTYTTTLTEPVNPTTWPISILDGLGAGTFERGGITQLNGFVGAPPVAFVPTNFNINIDPPNFTNFPPITYFWSDGNRRFFIINPLFDCCSCASSCCGPYTCKNKLMVSPFNIIEWNAPGPKNQILADPALAPINIYNWARHLGDTGIFMVGTSSGVVALE